MPSRKTLLLSLLAAVVLAAAATVAVTLIAPDESAASKRVVAAYRYDAYNEQAILVRYDAAGHETSRKPLPRVMIGDARDLHRRFFCGGADAQRQNVEIACVAHPGEKLDPLIWLFVIK